MVPSMLVASKFWDWLEKRQLVPAKGGTTAPGRRKKLGSEDCTPKVWWSSSRSITREGIPVEGNGPVGERDSVLVVLEALEARRRRVEGVEGPRHP